jgi:predicted 2-oxoglutarate/Fe(II)-dependent dioxygenase YbiX
MQENPIDSYISVKIKLDKGDVVIFPANFMYPHRIEPIINNTRYSLVCWGF